MHIYENICLLVKRFFVFRAYYSWLFVAYLSQNSHIFNFNNIDREEESQIKKYNETQFFYIVIKDEIIIKNYFLS